LEWNSKPGSNQPTYYACNIPIVVYAVPPDDVQMMLETRRSCLLLTNWRQKVYLVGCTRYIAMLGQQNSKPDIHSL
jgi:hypothetical protein